MTSGTPARQTPIGPSRRAILQGAGATLAAAALTGCGIVGGRRLQVAVLWSGDELARFRRVLAGYEYQSGRAVDVISGGDDIDSLIRARRGAGNSPDVAVLSRPGLLPGYVARGWVEPLRHHRDVASRFSPAWNELITLSPEPAAESGLYGAWVKAAHKSLIWYRPGELPFEPANWDGFRDRVDRLRAAGGPAPLAIGAADGWVLTDWLENVLAGVASAGWHERLVQGRESWRSTEVADALELLAELWRPPGTFPGGPGRALMTQYAESVIQVVDTHAAAMVFEGDFVAAVADSHRPEGTESPALDWFRFPAIEDEAPLVFGGDFAVVLEGAQEEAHDLVEWLTRPTSFESWIAAGGYLTPNLDVDEALYVGPERARERELLGLIRDAAPGDWRFDLSDRLPGEFGGSPGRGIWQILQEFFEAVTGPGTDVGEAISQTTDALETARAEASEASTGAAR